MKREDVLDLPSVPMASPSYPSGPYRFIDREYFIVTYESEPDAIREAVPESLDPDGSHTVVYEFIRMPDSSGFHENLICSRTQPARCDPEAIEHTLSKTQVNLKLIPHMDSSLAIAQLVAYNLTGIVVKGAWSGAARLHLIPHVNAPVADLPVKRIVGGTHFIADLTLPYGRVLYDYLAEPSQRERKFA